MVTGKLYQPSNGVSSLIRIRSNGAHCNGTHESSVPEQPSVFRDLTGCNVGFKNWHPIPVTPQGDKLAGHGEMGGVW